MSRRGNESGFTNVGCRHQTWHTAHRQAKLSTIHPTLVRPQLPAVPAPRSQQTLLKIFLLDLSLLGFSLAVPGLLLYLSHIAICRLVLVSISFRFSRIFLICISPFALLLKLMLYFFVTYPFCFLTPLALAGFLSHTRIRSCYLFPLNISPLNKERVFMCV